MNVFRFKQFEIIQEKSAMKVGTDGVLLGAWTVSLRENAVPRRILDIGTGTGVIALMLAQSFPSAMVEAIEIDHDAAEEAAMNAANSPWADRIVVKETSLKDFAKSIDTSSLSAYYDLIVCNPPFYNATLKPEDEARAKARHEDSLPFADVTQFADKFLCEDGHLSVIYPANNEGNIMLGVADSSLKIIEICDILTKIGKPCKRRMLLLGKTGKGEVRHSLLPLRNENNDYSDIYRTLTNDFYLSLKS